MWWHLWLSQRGVDVVRSDPRTDAWDKPLAQWREELNVVPFVNDEPGFRPDGRRYRL